MPEMAADVHVNDGSPKAAASPASSLWHTVPEPSGGHEQVQASGELAVMSAQGARAGAPAHRPTAHRPTALREG